MAFWALVIVTSAGVNFAHAKYHKRTCDINVPLSSRKTNGNFGHWHLVSVRDRRRCPRGENQTRLRHTSVNVYVHVCGLVAGDKAPQLIQQENTLEHARRQMYTRTHTLNLRPTSAFRQCAWRHVHVGTHLYACVFTSVLYTCTWCETCTFLSLSLKTLPVACKGSASSNTTTASGKHHDATLCDSASARASVCVCV